MVIGGTRAGLRFALARRAIERERRAVEGDVHLADHLRVGDRLGRPQAGVGVVRVPALGQEVERKHAELQRGTARNEQAGPVRTRARHAHERRVTLHQQSIEQRTAVAVLQDADAAAPQIDQVLLQLLQHIQRQRRRARAEVEHAATGHGANGCISTQGFNGAHARLTMVKRPALSTAGFLRIEVRCSSLGA